MNITVAEHTYKVIRVEEQILCPYRAFKTDNTTDTLFSLESATEIEPHICQIIGDFPDENGRTQVGIHAEGYRMDYFDPIDNHRFASLDCDHNFQNAQLVVIDPVHQELAVNNALMMLYTFTSSYHHTLMAHSSVIVHNHRAYLFLGKSGIGKSTHSRLWLTHIEGAQLLNDDNPIIRLTDRQATVYGSPWSGKTPCYKNESYPIGGIVRLQQLPENAIRRIKGAQALAALLPSFSTLPCHSEIQRNTQLTAALLAEQVPVYTLGCRPDAEAAQLCFYKITSQVSNNHALRQRDTSQTVDPLGEI